MIDLGAESHYSLFGVSPNADVTEIRDAHTRLAKELHEKLIAAHAPEEKEKIQKRLAQINAAGQTLKRLEERRKYDRDHAHLRFFTVQTAAVPLFVDKIDRMYVLHRVVREFLAAKGVALAPLSDVEREDFSADATPNELLDRLLS